VANGPSTVAATSPDGITWTSRTLPLSGNWITVAYGAGIFNSNGVLQIVNSTIASNSLVPSPSYLGYSASEAGANLANTGGGFLIKNSIIAYPGGNSNVWGTITDAGYNICSDNLYGKATRTSSYN